MRTLRVTLSFLIVCLFNQVSFTQDDPKENAKILQGIEQLEAIQIAFQKAIDKARPSVVSVYLADEEYQEEDYFRSRRRFRGLGRGNDEEENKKDPNHYTFDPVSFGSGIVIDKKGLILTAFHVIRPFTQNDQRGGLKIFVRTNEGDVFQASVHAADYRSDLAVIKLNVTDENKKFTPITIGKGEDVAVGQFALALGNPFGLASGDGKASASWGIVSNLRRKPGGTPKEFGADSDLNVPLYTYHTLIECDARMNMGISGGALINIRGEMIGVTMALAALIGSDSPGGFALPTDVFVRRVIETLRQGKEVEYGFLGITPRNQEITVTNNKPPFQELKINAVQVDNVIEWLPAYANGRGLTSQDFIIEIDGEKISKTDDLFRAVGLKEVGSIIETKVLRYPFDLDNIKTLKLGITKFPPRGTIITTKGRPYWNGMQIDHLSILANSWRGRRSRGDFHPDGVVVSDIELDSEAYKQNVRQGQIITHINNQRVTTTDQYYQQLKTINELGTASTVRFHFSDGNQVNLPTAPFEHKSNMSKPEDNDDQNNEGANGFGIS